LSTFVKFKVKKNLIFFSYNVLRNERKIQCLSLIDFRCQVRWQPESLSFDQFTTILNSIPNLQHFSCTLMTNTDKEKLIDSEYIDIELWRNLCVEFRDLIHLDCSIKCPLKSSTCFETDFVRIIANISRAPERSINIQLYHNNENINTTKNDVSTLTKFLLSTAEYYR